MAAPELPVAWLESIALAPARWETMYAGIQRFERWLEDQVVFGLASMEANPSKSLEPTAATLTDDQLPTVAAWLRSWIGRVGQQEDWALRFGEEMGRWHLLNRLVIKALSLDQVRFAGLMLHYGHRLQRARLASVGALVQDVWVCVGQVEGEDGPLAYRRTHLRGQGPDAALTLFQYAYGVALPPPILSIGEGGDFAMRVYPDGLPGRGAWPQGEDVEAAGVRIRVLEAPPHCFESWADMRRYQEELVLRQPWRLSLPVAVAGLRVGFGEPSGRRSQSGVDEVQRVLAIDREGAGVVLSGGVAAGDVLLGELVGEQLWRLIGLVDGGEFGLFGEVLGGRVVLWSVWSGGRMVGL